MEHLLLALAEDQDAVAVLRACGVELEKLRGDVVDALIICPIEAGLAAPFLIVFNTDSDNDARDTVADRLSEIWDRHVAGGGPAPAPGESK